MATGRVSRYPLPPATFGADGLQRCRYRQDVPLNGAGSGAVEVRCIAMGGAVLGRKDRDPQAIAAVCNVCRIPREAERRPCLYLVPMKTERAGEPKDYFACRWFYKDNPQAPYEDTDWMCGACPYWFPAPDDALKGLDRVVRRMLGYHRDVWRNPQKGPTTPRASTPPPTHWLRRVLDRFLWWALPV